MVRPVKAPRRSEKRTRELVSFLEKNNLNFNNLDLLNLAFTHTSFANEYKQKIDNNERLEFLGDSVLGFITADYLFTNFGEKYHEGEFSKIKSVVVSEASLAEVAETLRIADLLLVGNGELLQGGNKKKAVVADAVEALIAAIYLDQGIESARSFVLTFIPSQVEKLLTNRISYKDCKTMLQEYYQKKKGKTPLYTLVGVRGPDHAQIFSMTVSLGTRVFGPAEGNSKKSAEQAVAREALLALGVDKAEVPDL